MSRSRAAKGRVMSLPIGVFSSKVDGWCENEYRVFHISRYRVVKIPLIEGVASQKPLEGQPAAPQCAVLFHSLQGILGAGGDEAAAGGTGGGDIPPVEPDGGEEEVFHFSTLFSARPTSRAARSKAAVRRW